MPDAPTPAQRQKLARIESRPADVVALPTEMQGRRVPKGDDGAAALDVYLDGRLLRTVPARALERGVALSEVLRGGAARPRSVLCHGEGGNLWIGGAEVERFWLRVNRRGEIKLEPTSPAGPHAARGPGSATGPGVQDGTKRAVRDLEVRAVAWIEARSARAPTLAGEPPTGAGLFGPGGGRRSAGRGDGSGAGRGDGTGGGRTRADDGS